MEQTFSGEGTNHNHYLRCIVFNVIKGHNDVSKRGIGSQIESTLVYLVPTESTAKETFLNAWAPVVDENYEFYIETAMGIGKACVCKPNDKCNQYHIMVMDNDLSNLLISAYNYRNVEDLIISVTVKPENYEHEYFDNLDNQSAF